MMMMMITLFLSLSKLLKLGRCFVHVVIWCRDCMVGGGRYAPIGNAGSLRSLRVVFFVDDCRNAVLFCCS